MITILKGDIAHGHDTKLSREDGEDVAIGWGTKPSLKAKPFEGDPGDISTHGWGNKPNPMKDHTPTRGWGNKPNPNKDPVGIEVQGRHNNRLGKGGKVRSTLIPPKMKPTRAISR